MEAGPSSPIPISFFGKYSQFSIIRKKSALPVNDLNYIFPCTASEPFHSQKWKKETNLFGSVQEWQG